MTDDAETDGRRVARLREQLAAAVRDGSLVAAMRLCRTVEAIEAADGSASAPPAPAGLDSAMVLGVRVYAAPADLRRLVDGLPERACSPNRIADALGVPRSSSFDDLVAIASTLAKLATELGVPPYKPPADDDAPPADYGPLHYASATAACAGGRNDTGRWSEVTCADCLRARP